MCYELSDHVVSEMNSEKALVNEIEFSNKFAKLLPPKLFTVRYSHLILRYVVQCIASK